MLDLQRTVADVVLDHSECASIFQKHRIDYCCRGGLTVADAAAEKGVDANALLAELTRAVDGRRGDGGADPRALGTPQLVGHIVATHHAYLRQALPFVRALAAKVARVHGDHNPKLRELDAAVGELEAALLPHLDDEEHALFPALVAATPDTPSVARGLGAMAEDHLVVARLLERVRTAADDYRLPDWACNSYRTLFAELEHLEADVHTHVHLENHVLRPRFARA